MDKLEKFGWRNTRMLENRAYGSRERNEQFDMDARLAKANKGMEKGRTKLVPGKDLKRSKEMLKNRLDKIK